MGDEGDCYRNFIGDVFFLFGYIFSFFVVIFTPNVFKGGVCVEWGHHSTNGEVWCCHNHIHINRAVIDIDTLYSYNIAQSVHSKTEWMLGDPVSKFGVDREWKMVKCGDFSML